MLHGLLNPPPANPNIWLGDMIYTSNHIKTILKLVVSRHYQ